MFAISPSFNGPMLSRSLSTYLLCLPRSLFFMPPPRSYFLQLFFSSLSLFLSLSFSLSLSLSLPPALSLSLSVCLSLYTYRKYPRTVTAPKVPQGLRQYSRPKVSTHSTSPYSTAPARTVQHLSVQCSTALVRLAQYSTCLHSTVQCNMVHDCR
jgi:hypothetical protein